MSCSPSLCLCGLHGMQQAGCVVPMSVSLHEQADQAEAGKLRHNMYASSSLPR